MATSTKVIRNVFSVILSVLIITLVSGPVCAEETEQPIIENSDVVQDSTEVASDSNSNESVSELDETALADTQASTMSATAEEAEDPTSELLPTVPENYIYTGAARYSIPIKVPPGRNGIEPDITLKYNSYLKNGWVGVGWRLDMGAIRRSTKRGVNYNANDYVYEKDGLITELVQKSGNEYRAKIEGEFTQYYLDPSGGWEVTTRNGTKYFYGTYLSSRQDNEHGIFKWCLYKVEDTNGNSMTISYSKDQGQIYPDQIDYTGNTYVKFNLEDRNDVSVMYNSISEVRTAKRLGSIEIYAGVQFVRKYELAYDYGTSSKRSRLIDIQEYGSDNNTLPPVTFGWKEGGDGAFIGNNPTMDFQDDFLSFTHVDGDGFKDFIYYEYIEPRRRVYKYQIRPYLYNNSDGTFIAGEESTLEISFSSWGDPSPSLHCADVNGDGLADLIDVESKKDKVTIFCNNGDGTFSEDSLEEINIGTKVYFVDVNGDGLADLIKFENGKIYTYRNDGYGSFLDVSISNVSLYGDLTSFADIDGNGYTDIIFYDLDYYENDNGVITINKNNLHIYLSNGDGTFGGSITTSLGGGRYYHSIPDSVNPSNFADFNGDGLADFLQKDKTFLSKGDGTFISNGNGFGSYAYYNGSFFADVNGDGFDDLIGYIYHYDEPDNGNGTITDSYTVTRLSNGDGTFRAGVETTLENENNQLITGDLYFNDLDGNGTADLIILDNGHSFLSGNPPDLLTSINNGLGATTTIGYTHSSRCPDTILPFVVHPVSIITVNDGLGPPGNPNESVTTYSYSGGLYDYNTREFRGFKEVTTVNPDESKNITWFHQGEYLKGKPYEIQLKEPEGLDSLLTKTTLTWDKPFLDPPDNTCAFVKLTQKRTEFDNDVTIYKQEEYFYDDSNGTLTTSISSGTDAENITTNYLYFDYGYGDWIWRVSKETIEGSISNKVRETFYGYDESQPLHGWTAPPNRGNLTSIEYVCQDCPPNPKEWMTYDDYGNQTTVYDAKDNPTATEYDADTHTYPVKITYPQTGNVTHIVEYEEYDYRYGKVKKSKDENGNRTDYDYDEFGRLTQVDYPDGGQTKTEYFDTVFPRYQINKVVEEDTDGNSIDAYQYFDGLGRTIQTITFGENDKSIVTRMYYDEMGRNDLVEGPFFSTGVGYPKTPSSSYFWEQTTYDYRSRPIEIKRPDSEYGPIVWLTFSYSGFSTTITDADGSQKTEKKDYLGRIIKVTEHAETGQQHTEYGYNAAGDMLNVMDHFGYITTINYDTLGRKINMTDPDMGYWVYTYDANGNLWIQTDAKGQTITFDYDELNRLKSKIYSTSDPTVTYLYDNLSIPNGRGRLYSVSNTNVTSTYNAYDAMGRNTGVSKTIIGNPTYTTQYGYDLSGKPISTKYPDTYQVDYAYYPGTRLLHTVTGNSTEYALLTLYEPTGKIGKIEHNNDTETSYTYDPLSTRLTGIISKKTSGPEIQNREYKYYPAGDIKEIKDNQKIITYSYTYDYLHRLKTETNTGTYNPISYGYNAIGNIEYKTVGTDTYNYTAYSPAHKHAVSNINLNGSPYGFLYDPNGNMIEGHDFSDPAQVATRNITYNTDNMPKQISHTRGGNTVTMDLLYDGNSVRAKKSVQGDSTTLYVNDQYEVIDGAATKYIFAGNLRIAKIAGSDIKYYHKDHLGSSTVMTNSSGTDVETTEYMPYGHMRDHTGSEVTNYKFTDQELDPESGLYNYNARLYDPVIGRFISADTIVPYPFNPQSLNRYSYCHNNPLIYTDPTGHHIGGANGPTGEHDLDDNPGNLGSNSSSGVNNGSDDFFGELNSYNGYYGPTNTNDVQNEETQRDKMEENLKQEEIRYEQQRKALEEYRKKDLLERLLDAYAKGKLSPENIEDLIAALSEILGPIVEDERTSRAIDDYHNKNVDEIRSNHRDYLK